ncbi:MAG: insulinase family protein [bacterium]|nr:insulinase family protein [bacterium]
MMVKRLLTVTFLLFFVFLSLLFYLLFCPVLKAESTVTSFRLPNGLSVILAPVDHIKAACVLLYHSTGVRNDPPEVKGGSYLYEHLMSLGRTQNFDKFDRVAFIRSIGGTSHQKVNYDYSVFYQVVPETELDGALWHESERIGSLHLTTADINTVKKSIYARHYFSNTTSIDIQASNWMKAKIFEGTVYETPIYGKLEEIQGFPPRAIRQLYSNFTNLSNIVVVIAGKFDAAKIRRMVNKHFAGLPSSPGPSRKNKWAAAGPRTEYKYKNWEESNLKRPFMMYGFRGPSKFSYDYLFFDFIRYYLVDPRISKLEALLNLENNLDAVISTNYTRNFEDNALLIRLSCKAPIDLQRVRANVNKFLLALNKGRPGTISKEDFRMTKSLMEIDFLKQMTSLEKRSLFLAENYLFSGTIDSEKRIRQRIHNLNIDDIYRIGKKYFGKNNWVNLNVYPK